MKQKNHLNVFMNHYLVGKLEKAGETSMSFTYDSSWLIMPGARPISLSLPLTQQKYTGNVVYNFFDNLLPDNYQIRTRIQRKFSLPTLHSFDLLAAIGKDCVGAVQLLKENIIPEETAILCEPLNESRIASILRNIQTNPLGMFSENNDFRISIAGAQEKAAFLFFNNQWNAPFGSTPTTHIFKLPIGQIHHQHIDLSDSCENEWLCSKIALAFGLSVAHCEIEYFENMKALIVERFDRKFIQNQIIRLPQEDMCQTLGISANLKYQADGGPGIKDIMQVLLSSKESSQDRDTFFSSQILFWLLAAIDGHAKNFSLLIGPAGTYKLAPLYDIMSAYPLIANQNLQLQKIKMAMALRGKHNYYLWRDIQRRYFQSTANNSNYSIERAEKILESMLAQVDIVIENVSKQLPEKFPNEISEPIFEGMRKAKQRLI